MPRSELADSSNVTQQGYSMLYKRCFPDFDSVLPLVPGFVDASYKNDTCPRMRCQSLNLTLWCDYVNADLRESGSAYRFALVDDGTDETMLETNDINEVFDCLSSIAQRN